MDETQLFHQVLWRRYFSAEEDLDKFKKKAEDYTKKADEAYHRSITFKRALEAEGLDLRNPPSEFRKEAPVEDRGAAQPQEDASRPLAQEALVVYPGQGSGDPAPSNGSNAPLNKTHATFVLMRAAQNRLLSLDEIHQLGRARGYDLPKDDIGRVIARQMARGLMEKVDGKFRQTAAGVGFNNFLPRKASVQG